MPNRPNHSDIGGSGYKVNVVAIDGKFVTIQNCYVHSCAATGIYIGGPGSVVNVERTDILQNGHGNECCRLGIARGHSGVYLEQGTAHLSNCNISQNSLNGISAILADNSTLLVEDSGLVSNRSLQLEMPLYESISWKRSVMLAMCNFDYFIFL